MKELRDFLAAIGVEYEPAGARLNLNDKRFTVPLEVAEQIHDRGRLVYAGRLLGRTRVDFIPGAGLLREICKIKGSNRVWIDDRVGWLFACGRDVFEESILRSEGELIERAYFLVMLGENCLGYVRLETREGKRIFKNVFDLGDFLRRERGIENV